LTSQASGGGLHTGDLPEQALRCEIVVAAAARSRSHAAACARCVGDRGSARV